MQHHSRKVLAGIAMGMLAAAPSVSDPPASVTYSYDDLGRLRTGQFTGGASDGRNVDYQYDAAGNRTTMSSGTPTRLTIGAAASVTEGGVLSFPVTRTGSSPQPMEVSCVPQNGSAVAGGAAPLDDYVNAPQSVVFYPSDPSPITKTCTIATKTDSYYEGAQSVTLTLQNATVGATILPPGSASGTILDNNSAPAFSVSGSAGTEGSAVGFTIIKSGLTELAHSVTYASANGSALLSDNDYTAVGPAVATFSGAQTQVAVAVNTTSDAKYETAESVFLNLSAPTNGAVIAVASASATINNNDAPPAFVINDPAAANEGSVITFTIRNTGNTNTALTHSVSWATANGTAAAGSDYVAGSGSVSFGPGEVTKAIGVQTRTDGVYEGGTETFVVNLSTTISSNGAVIADGQGLGSIADIDNPVPAVPLNLRISSPTPASPNYTRVLGRGHRAGGLLSVVGGRGDLHHHCAGDVQALHQQTAGFLHVHGAGLQRRQPMLGLLRTGL